MGIGFALGGIAKGLQAEQELGVRNRAADLQTQELKSNDAYRNAMLALENKRVNATAGLEGANKARALYDGLLSNVKDVIEKSLKAGTPIANITEAIKPQVAYMQQLAPVAGIDTSVAASQISSWLNSGIQKSATSASDVLGPILDKFSKQQPLSKTEKALLDNYFKQSNPFAGLISGATQGTDLATPAPSSLVPDAQPAPAAGAPVTTAPPTAAQAAPPTASSAPHPPVPANLIGKAIAWSATAQRFYDKAGNAYNQQGVPVPQ